MRFKLEFPQIREESMRCALDSEKERIAHSLICAQDAYRARDIKGMIICLQRVLGMYKRRGINKRFIPQNEIDLEIIIKGLEKLLAESEASKETDNKQLGKEPDPPHVIFISHSSKDKKYADLLVKFIKDLGINDEQLIYTSHQDNDVPLNQNTYNYLGNNIHNNTLMIILWSDSYLDSKNCAYETGATWGVKCDYKNLFVPEFSFNNSMLNYVPLDYNKMGITLNGDNKCKVDVEKLKSEIQNIFNLNEDKKSAGLLLDNFMLKIRVTMGKET
jgi:hypothetical protein